MAETFADAEVMKTDFGYDGIERTEFFALFDVGLDLSDHDFVYLESLPRSAEIVRRGLRTRRFDCPARRSVEGNDENRPDNCDRSERAERETFQYFQDSLDFRSDAPRGECISHVFAAPIRRKMRMTDLAFRSATAFSTDSAAVSFHPSGHSITIAIGTADSTPRSARC